MLRHHALTLAMSVLVANGDARSASVVRVNLAGRTPRQPPRRARPLCGFEALGGFVSGACLDRTRTATVPRGQRLAEEEALTAPHLPVQLPTLLAGSSAAAHTGVVAGSATALVAATTAATWAGAAPCPPPPRRPFVAATGALSQVGAAILCVGAGVRIRGMLRFARPSPTGNGPRVRDILVLREDDAPFVSAIVPVNQDFAYPGHSFAVGRLAAIVLVGELAAGGEPTTIYAVLRGGDVDAAATNTHLSASLVLQSAFERGVLLDLTSGGTGLSVLAHHSAEHFQPRYTDAEGEPELDAFYRYPVGALRSSMATLSFPEDLVGAASVLSDSERD